MRERKYSVIEYVLLALVPYSKPNLKLVFRPHDFFYELEKISRAKRTSLQTTLARAQKQGLVKRQRGIPVLTKRGFARVEPYVAQTLKKEVMLMVIFDIPEEQAYLRRQLRTYLHGHNFRQVQKSVWTTKYDHRKSLQTAVAELGIKPYVETFECARIS